MNNKEWAQMRYMVCNDYSANLFETEADALESLNDGKQQWIFAIRLEELPTRIIEVKAKKLVVDRVKQ